MGGDPPKKAPEQEEQGGGDSDSTVEVSEGAMKAYLKLFGEEGKSEEETLETSEETSSGGQSD